MTLLDDCSIRRVKDGVASSLPHLTGALHSFHSSGAELNVICQAGLKTPMATPRMEKFIAVSVNVNGWWVGFVLLGSRVIMLLVRR